MDVSLNIDSLRDLPGTLPNLTITPQTRTSEDDLRMARACADGSSEAFAAIYSSHGERMKSIAFNHLGNISDAEAAFTTWLTSFAAVLLKTIAGPVTVENANGSISVPISADPARPSI